MSDYDPEKYWQERGKDYKVSVDTSAELRNLARLRLLQGWYSDQILEVGSGYGRIYEHLKSNRVIEAQHYSMCDISQSMINECYRRTGIKPLRCTTDVLPYDDESFDWIISFSVFLHVPPDDLFEFFKEHVRVCKKYLYIATYVGHADALAKHCFRHDYVKLIVEFNMKIINQKIFMDGKRVNWLLKKA